MLSENAQLKELAIGLKAQLDAMVADQQAAAEAETAAAAAATEAAAAPNLHSGPPNLLAHSSPAPAPPGAALPLR